MSELLRTQQCIHEVHRCQNTDCEHDHRFQSHIIPSLQAIAETHVADCQSEKHDRNRYPNGVLHKPSLQATVALGARISRVWPCLAGSRSFADPETRSPPMAMSLMNQERQDCRRGALLPLVRRSTAHSQPGSCTPSER